MKSDFLIALTQLAAERRLPREAVLQAIEAALASAFKKDSIAAGHNIAVKLNPQNGEITMFALKEVVEAVEDPRRQMTPAEAKRIKKDAKVGDTIELPEALPQQASRIAAQTAKQVVLQRLREAERELVYAEFNQKVDDIITGTVDTMEGGRILLDLGRAQAVIPPEEQVPTERYRKGQRLKVYVLEVRRSAKGPEIVVSRTHKNLLKRLFELEVPEVYNGVVEIKAIAREAGSRSKVAVSARQDGVDPVGSCIGMRGNRIQNIVNELQAEKIDVVRWDKELSTFISHALSPAEVSHIELDKATKSATVVVPDRQLSLAIGKEGQNVRLAVKLTGCRLDIKGATDWDEIRAKRAEEEEARKAAERAAREADEARRKAEVEAQLASEVKKAAEEAVAAAEAAPVEAESQPEPAVAQQAPAQEPEAPAEVVKAPEPAVAQQAPVQEPEPEKTPALSAEEELAAAAVAESQPAEEEEEEEPQAVETNPLDERIWQLPNLVPEAGRIRFAEEILGDRRGRGGGGKNKERRGRDKGRETFARRGGPPGGGNRPGAPRSGGAPRPGGAGARQGGGGGARRGRGGSDEP